MVKLFPAGQMPVGYIKALQGPIDDVHFVAVGGVRPHNIAEFFKAGCAAIGIGGSILKSEWVESGNFRAITEETKKYADAVAAASS
jgi:2-dehydro-3-deoxyphosphogluconate aldolase/(4S)-4-hydroxy-2-oxoglutarate aldolase